ncbi:MAG: hypothetical protein ACLGSD_19280 [Acidobacteriota bacterium]
MRQLATGSYPRIYRTSTGWRILFIFAAILLLALGIYVGWIAFPGHSKSASASLILAPVSLGFIFIAASSFATVLFFRLVLFEDQIEYQLLISKRALYRRQIRGWRIAPTTPPTLILQPVDKESRAIKIGLIFHVDEALTNWLDLLPSLDDQELKANEDEIENDSRLGHTPRDRSNKIRRIKSKAKVLNGFSIAVLIWGYFYPHPYLLVMLVLIALPWVALLMTKLSHGALRIDEKKNDPHPTVAYAYMFPGFVLLLRAIFDFNVVQSTYAVLLYTAVSAALTYLAVIVDPTIGRKKAMIAVIIILAAAYGYGAVVVANGVFDSSPKIEYATTLLNKHVDQGKHVSYHLELGPWGPETKPNDIEVTAATYGAIKPGDSITLALRHGALGVRWYFIRDWQSNGDESRPADH